MGGKFNIGWSAFLLFFHLLGELIPMTILFVYQFKSNKLWLKNKMQMSMCKQENNPYACAGLKNHGSNDGEGDDGEDDSYYNEDEIVVENYCS